MKQERLVKAQAITKKMISEYIITQLPELTSEHGIVTVTEVQISSDLWYIDVLVSALKNQNTLTKTLSEHAHPIHKMLGKNLALVKVPKVRFRYDESGKNASEIYNTIQNLHTK